MLDNTATSVNTCSSNVRDAHQFGGRRNKAGLQGQQVPARSVARFHTKYQKTAGCWLWQAGKYVKGYGMFNVGRNDGRQHTEYAHRIAYVLAKGDIPQGLVVMHSCDTPACVNPAHLSLGTQGDNIRDGVSRGRYSVPRLPRRKLTDAQVHEIRQSSERGCRLAPRFGVSTALVSMIRRGSRRAA